MTGYCSLNEQVQLPQAGSIGVTVELKTLNGRFFEVVARLPSSLSHLELPMNGILQEKLTRGRIYLNVRLDDKQSALSVIEPAWHAIDQYMSAAQSIKQKYKLGGDLVIADVMGLPNVFAAQENVITPETEKTLLALVSKAADAVLRMRQGEGSRLEKDFERIFKTCAEKVAIVESNFHQVMEHHKELVRQALAAATPDQSTQQADELQNSLRKLDIHEEITRFKSHLDSVAPVFKATGVEKGKRIDFILQELMRETNTMMAKCSAYPVSSLCIDIKVELEKAREQVQNIV